MTYKSFYTCNPPQTELTYTTRNRFLSYVLKDDPHRPYIIKVEKFNITIFANYKNKTELV